MAVSQGRSEACEPGSTGEGEKKTEGKPNLRGPVFEDTSLAVILRYHCEGAPQRHHGLLQR